MSGVQGQSPWWGSGRSPEVFPILDTPRCVFLAKMMTDISNHEEGCRCWQCLSIAMGRFIDSLSSQTGSPEWQVFATITYRTPNYPWCRGFPTNGSGRPKADFAHHFFDRFVTHLETEIGWL